MPDWIRKPTISAHPLETVLQDANGPIDLIAGSIVRVRAKVPGALVSKIDAAATVVSPGAAVGNIDRGRVRYTLTTPDLDTPGIYEVDFKADIPGLGTQIFPEDGFNYLLVLPGADAT